MSDCKDPINTTDPSTPIIQLNKFRQGLSVAEATGDPVKPRGHSVGALPMPLAEWRKQYDQNYLALMIPQLRVQTARGRNESPLTLRDMLTLFVLFHETKVSRGLLHSELGMRARLNKDDMTKQISRLSKARLVVNVGTPKQPRYAINPNLSSWDVQSLLRKRKARPTKPIPRRK